MNDAVKEGDNVLLFLNKKKWLVRVTNKENRKFHTHLGYVNLSDLINKEYGSNIKTSTGEDLWILRPSITDLILKGERKTQVVYPKDTGMIIAITGISPGSRVVEAGTGSGALTTFIANLVRPNGQIFSYEIREEFINIARRNIEKAGLEKFVTLKLRDAKEGFDEDNIDTAIIDVGDPWTLVEPAHRSLKGGGILAAICPTMNQVEKLVDKLGNSGFISINSMEIIVRGLEARPNMTRPSMRMIGHTAYLTFARKILINDKMKS